MVPYKVWSSTWILGVTLLFNCRDRRFLRQASRPGDPRFPIARGYFIEDIPCAELERSIITARGRYSRAVEKHTRPITSFTNFFITYISNQLTLLIIHHVPSEGWAKETFDPFL